MNVIQDVSASIPNGILNPADIDWDFIVNSLITPKGLVTQFALEVEVQSIFTLGWIIAGVIWQVVVLNTTGELQVSLNTLKRIIIFNIFISDYFIRTVIFVKYQCTSSNCCQVILLFPVAYLEIENLCLAVNTFETILPNVFRSLFDSARSLASRLIITIFVYGWEDTVRKCWTNFHLSNFSCYSD